MTSITTEHEALADVVAWIDHRYAGIALPADERSRICAGCFDVALEHQAAICLLSSAELYGPLFALLRVLFEAVVRGLWLAQCASDADLKKFQKHRFDQKFGELVRDIENVIGRTGSPLSKLMTNSWKAMNGFTHTGFHQVARRNGEGFTGPNYPDAEINQAVALSAALGLIAACQLAGIASDQPLVRSTMERMQQYADRSLGSI